MSKIKNRPQVESASIQLVTPVGIDVSKDKLDVQLLHSSDKNAKHSYKQFSNAPSGFAKLVRWVEQLNSQLNRQTGLDRKPHYCMESTGSYSEALAQFLAEGEHLVSVVNPYLVKHYGECSNMLNKNDRADALVIAHYCRAEQPSLWYLSRPQVRALIKLVRRLQGLQQHLQQENNRLQEPGLIKPVVRSIQKSIRFLEKEIASVKAEIRRHIDSDDGPGGLKESMELLLSVPGIGETLATSILAELPDVSTFKSASSVGAYAGLSPKEHQSGTSVNKKTRISRKGNAHLRCALFMPALSAYRHNPLLAELYERLTKRGMPRKAAVCAVMRKLLMMAYGVLKNRQPFQLDWVKQQQDERRRKNTSNALCVSAG